ncbi:MAG: type II secretion system F family protein [Nocardioidaceae bacterium]|nr:type II secretion system F family protein [Nocardioidaceae bacterium]
MSLPWALVAAGCAAAACLVLLGPAAATGLARLGSSAPSTRSRWVGRAWRAGPPALGVGATLVLLASEPAVLLLALAGAVVAWAALDLRRRQRARAEATTRRDAVAELCDALVAALGAGVPAETALSDLAGDWPFLRPVARTAGLGGDVPAAWRDVARQRGGADLGHVAAAWEVSTRTGSPLAATVARIAGALRDTQEVRREVESSLGPSRATARLLAVLPVLGLGLGAGLGGDPLSMMASSVPVAGCVLVGVGLAVTGVVWVERVADAAAGT